MALNKLHSEQKAFLIWILCVYDYLMTDEQIEMVKEIIRKEQYRDFRKEELNRILKANQAEYHESMEKL